MKPWTVLACAAMLALSVGCNARSRYEILSMFFDGVPPPKAADVESAAGGATAPAEIAQAKPRDHGPYAARLCTACHESAATNALVAPREQLCFRCHEIKLDKKYVHGPLASGGRLACHDPHGSRYRYMLIAESGTFCLHCHDRETVARNPAHAGVAGQCTNCH